VVRITCYKEMTRNKDSWTEL